VSARPSLLSELKRRDVLRAAVLYAGAVWALAQGLAQLLPLFGDYGGALVCNRGLRRAAVLGRVRVVLRG
jgi:hypothetical protein